tara:strand:+ start:1212 stop:1454 length:243 start_codon:yes stop_codon:yes gene_type:complete
MLQLALYVATIGVILNLTLAFGFSVFATNNQQNPPNGAANLGFWDQIMHMLVHHKQVPITSSLIVFALIVASVVITSFVM